MPRYGGLSPYPNRFGGSGPQGVRLKILLDSLNRQRGTAYDTTSTSTVYAENMATARVLNEMWSANQRMANQIDVTRMSTSLPRWEKILNITPGPTDSDATRRARIASLFARTGNAPFTSYVMTQLASLLGPVFVALEFISYANAVIHVPDTTYPWGTVATGSPWYSTTAHVLIRVVQPSGYANSDFSKAVGLIFPFMDSVMPAWITWDWYQAPQTGAPIAVVGGPSAGGWYLDERNLDASVFDV